MLASENHFSIKTALLLVVFSCPFVAPTISFPQAKNSSVDLSIAEPAVISASELFRQADTVALVKIVSADDENYPAAVYKGQILKSYKGVGQPKTIYYGPFIGGRLGGEYVVFLRRKNQPLIPKKAGGGYGKIPYQEIFNQGYGSWMVSYQCVFGENEPSKNCGDAVRVCTDYVTLPKSMPSFPEVDQSTPSGCRWVRKENLMAMLDGFAALESKIWPEELEQQTGRRRGTTRFSKRNA